MIFASTFSSEISLRFVAQKTHFFFKFIVTYYIDTVVGLLAMPSSWDVVAGMSAETARQTRRHVRAQVKSQGIFLHRSQKRHQCERLAIRRKMKI